MKEEQPNLFGEAETVYNTLHSQLTRVNDEISSHHKSIDKHKDKIMVLEGERAELKKSISIVEKHREDLGDEEPNPIPEEGEPVNNHDPIDVKLTQKLVNMMQDNNPNSSTIKRLTPKRQDEWINSCRLMRERDERTPEQIEAMIEFSQKDSFWKSNILSMPKLREKFDQLWLKAEKDNYNGIKGWLDEKRREEEKDPF